MALIAMMAVIVGPWFMKIIQRNKIRSAAREIQSTLLAARMKAVRLNAPVRVDVASAVQPMAFQTVEPDPPAPTPTRVPARLELPSDSARFVATPSAGTVIFGGDGRLAGLPAPTPSIIIVEGPLGSTTMNQITIQITSGGRVQVITPLAWK